MLSPSPVTDIELVFPAHHVVDRLLPPFGEIPEEFVKESNKWCHLASGWFFSGLRHFPPVNPGLDLNEVTRHLSAVMSSFAPKHEHTIAGVAYLMSLWFQDQSADTLASLIKRPS